MSEEMTEHVLHPKHHVVRWLLVILAVVALSWLGAKAAGSDITGEEARVLVADGAVLLDVRTSTEYAAGHIAGAVNISVAGLATQLDAVGPRDRPVVVYCRSGKRSARAKRVLREAGFSEVYDLGAMRRW